MDGADEMRSRRFVAKVWQRVAAPLCIAIAMSLLTSCATGASSAAPATKICGTTIWSSAAGATVQDVSHGGSVTQVSAGEYLFLRVSDSCWTGVSVELQPASAARVVKRAKSWHGGLSGVVLAPMQHSFSIQLRDTHGKATTIPVDVARLPPIAATQPPAK